MRHTCHTLLCAFLVVLSMKPASASAQSGATVCVQVDSSTTECDTGPVASLQKMSVYDDEEGFHGFSLGQGYGAPGRLHAMAYSDTWGLTGDATVRVTITDTLTIESTDPAVVPGVTRGLYVARLRYNGELQASALSLQGGEPGSASAGVQAMLRWQSSPFNADSRSAAARRWSNGSQTGSPVGTLLSQVVFVFGEPIEIELMMTTRADANGFGDPRSGGVSRSRYQNSAYWGGIDEVLLEDTSQPVSSFSVTSASGADYRVDFGLDPVFSSGFEPGEQ